MFVKLSYYAHSAQDKLGNLLPYEHWQTLQSHSVNVGEMVAEFARVFGAQEIACQTGKLHDLGKYSEAFNRLRSEILDHTVEQAAQPHGLFTLTIPTSGGKTFTSTSMAFTLEHAKRQGMRRVIYVIPFTSIIEQNAAEFRKAFDKTNCHGSRWAYCVNLGR